MNALLTTLLAADDKAPSGGLLSFLPMLVILGGLFYFMTASSRKQKKQAAEMMSSLQVGDDVVTSGGIHGTINYLEDQVAHVKIDTDTVIRVNKSAITRVTSSREGDDEVVADVTDADANGSSGKPSLSKKPR